MTRGERDRVVRQAYEAAPEPGLNPRTRRKHATTADFVAFFGGTGVRIDEAHRLRWDQVDVGNGRMYTVELRAPALIAGSTCPNGF